MPNGISYDQADWKKAQEYLEPTDGLWRSLADRFGVGVEHDYHNVPGRSVSWSDTLGRKISLSLFDHQSGRFALDVFAWSDESGERRLAHERLRGDLAGPELAEQLPALLEKAVATVGSWAENDLA